MAEGEVLIARITEKGAKIAVLDLIDLSDIIASATDPLVQIVLEANQKMMLKIAVHMAPQGLRAAREQTASGIEVAKAKGVYKGRKPDTVANATIVELRGLGYHRQSGGDPARQRVAGEANFEEGSRRSLTRYEVRHSPGNGRTYQLQQ